MSGEATEQVRRTSLEAGRKFLEAGPRPDKSDPPDQFGTTTGQVRWGSLESGETPLEAGLRLDKSGPPD
jgi:hypothetical protein